MKNVLITRKTSDGQDFVRADYYLGRWLKHGTNGQVLHTIISRMVEELGDASGDMSATISSCRSAREFADPMNADIADGLTVTVLVPIDQKTGDAERDRLRLWTTLTWHSPDQPPVRGEKLRQKTLGAWLGGYFSKDQYANWKKQNTAGRVEVWLRPTWNAAEMFPDLFPKPDNTTPKEQKTKPKTPPKK